MRVRTQRELFNYIKRVSFLIKSNGSGGYVLSARACRDETFSMTFYLDQGKSSSVDEVFSELLRFIPNKRRFFVSSKSIMKDIMTPEFIQDISDKLTKKAQLSVWAEMLNYTDIDKVFENIGISSIKELGYTEYMSDMDCIDKSLDILLFGEEDGKIVDVLWDTEKAVNAFKADTNWVQQARGGQDNLNELFEVCGNHMLGSFFNIDKEKEERFKVEQKINIAVARETLIADIQEQSVLSAHKVFVNVIKDGDGYKIMFESPTYGSAVYSTSDIKDSDNSAWFLNNVLPQKRLFIGYGEETLENVRKMYEIVKDDKASSPVFRELMATYIDLEKPFRKVLIGKSLNDILKIFKIKVKDSRLDNIQNLDTEVFKDIRKSIELCANACLAYLMPISNEQFDKTYKSFFNAVFGQSFKYFYNVSSDVNI